MSTTDTIHLILWLGLLLAFMVVLSITLVRLWKKRPLKRPSIVAATLLACWLSLSPIFDWLWRRETMTRIFGQTFAPKMVYSKIAKTDFLLGDGTDVYVFEISKDRISSLTNAAQLSAMGFPRKDRDPEMEAWRTIHWQQAPFLNDTHDIQLIAFSGGAAPISGASYEQLHDLMSQPSTMFACLYQSGPGTNSQSPAYMVDFYILVPATRRLIAIFSKI